MKESSRLVILLIGLLVTLAVGGVGEARQEGLDKKEEDLEDIAPPPRAASRGIWIPSWTCSASRPRTEKCYPWEVRAGHRCNKYDLCRYVIKTGDTLWRRVFEVPLANPISIWTWQCKFPDTRCGSGSCRCYTKWSKSLLLRGFYWDGIYRLELLWVHYPIGCECAKKV